MGEWRTRGNQGGDSSDLGCVFIPASPCSSWHLPALAAPDARGAGPQHCGPSGHGRVWEGKFNMAIHSSDLDSSLNPFLSTDACKECYFHSYFVLFLPLLYHYFFPPCQRPKLFLFHTFPRRPPSSAHQNEYPSPEPSWDLSVAPSIHCASVPSSHCWILMNFPEC